MHSGWKKPVYAGKSEKRRESTRPITQRGIKEYMDGLDEDDARAAALGNYEGKKGKGASGRVCASSSRRSRPLAIAIFSLLAARAHYDLR